MTPTEEGTVVLNGNNPDLNGITLELEDEQLSGDDKTIVTLFRNALIKGSEDDPVVGDSATVNYRWDNPDIEGDEIAGWQEKKSVPGTSIKTSYIEVGDILEEARKTNQSLIRISYIFGSGIHPTAAPATPATTTNDDDDGCAIAGTENHLSQSALVNLLLMASVLLSVVFLRRRA